MAAAARAEQRVLQMTVGQIFEETLEFQVDWPDANLDFAKEQHVEMVLDRGPAGDGSAKPTPAKGAVVKTVEIDVNSISRIQNMPCGRNFLIRGVVVLHGGSKLCSDWVRTRTKPETKATAEDSQDINGQKRGKCKACPCKEFRWDKGNIHVNSALEAAICRGCGCSSHYHEAVGEPVVVVPPQQEPQRVEEAPLWRDPASVRLPQDAVGWDQRERDLYVQSGGRFHPRQMEAALRRTAKPDPTDPKDALNSRLTVVCPTTDARHEFHEQLYAVFEAQQWDDKELVVVETYKEKPSAFLQEKSKSDDRFIYVPFRVDPEHDWSIGLKRNVCTHLASGFFIANFDDDDLYAPSYLKTLVGSMVKQQCEAITLSSWYVFDVSSSKFGLVDVRNRGEEWLYGYGFSYIFVRWMNLEFPYPDCNLGEDFKFFNQLRKLQQPSMLGGFRHVALYKDDDGICCHTLHPKATSGSFAKVEVPLEEVPDLFFAELGLMDQYMSRFQKTSGGSRYIGGSLQRIERNVKVLSSFGSNTLTCHSGTTAAELKELLVPLLRWVSPEELQLHRSAPAESEREEGQRWQPEGSPMPDGERVGRRTTQLWVTLPVDRGDPPEVQLRIVDLADANIGVNVQVHRMVRLEGVRRALQEQHTQRGREAQARAVRLAEAVGSPDPNGNKTFMAADMSELLGDRRRMYARCLAEMLGQDRSGS